MEYAYAFHPGELDRAAQLRADDSVRQDARAQTLVFWKGKLLADAEGQPERVALDHKALCDSREAPIFVGLTPDGPLFAADISLWAPIEDATTIGQLFRTSQIQSKKRQPRGMTACPMWLHAPAG